MSDLIIWGAGRIGVCALHFYNGKKYNVLCFVDSNPAKWGTMVEGVVVNSPNVLLTQDCDVVVANRYDVEAILDEIRDKYGERRVFSFNVYDEEITAYDTAVIDYSKAISLSFTGGLGNQMFQYAVYKAMSKLDREVYIRNKTNSVNMAIENTFKNIFLRKIGKKEEDKIVTAGLSDNSINVFFAIYKEDLSQGTVKTADTSVLRIDSGIVQGMFQTKYFAESYREDLLFDFKFTPDDRKLGEIVKEINACNSVSIHVRRGDYLTGNNEFIYGDICTSQYYFDAIRLISEKISDPVFYLFSDNVDEAIGIIKEKSVRVIEREAFDNYQDWYDMYLMTQCNHNIIANSTFSWWGAWLNQYANKIVITPNHWTNTFDYQDIFPESWIKI